ncbi:phenylalanine 4-monooxygenase [Spongiactinospora sp. TRM90649]|uniref:phenylalanine 4-monooxygenase n=1 Tax=Spongiactinospora sp. TRM90649 TaxID=3031114 RepID=UPI0023F6E252|nr:phenylalanine 4-monooxygenase [Spongiactinospora sp. TRM90649]MDF5752097.1 phenylalanine 4-monooxygenase [Spongiactinospora sp. TRM90649]
MSDVWRRTPVSADGVIGSAAEHPGLRDPRYLARRRAFGARARGHRVGDPSPPVEYTEAEVATWRTVHRTLGAAHREHACREALDGREAAEIPPDRIPTHAEVGSRLRGLTGFDLTLAGGAVANKRFLGSMALGYFHAVQFVRHPAVPMYSPEPDILHDVFGHGIHLAMPAFASVYRLIGEAAARLETEEALQIVSDLYWFTLEYGVIAEGGRTKAYGAALLSSFGELGSVTDRQVRELDVPAMLATPYEISGYQPVLFRARSLNHLTDVLAAFLATLDDGTARLIRSR